MKRREFLATTAAAFWGSSISNRQSLAGEPTLAIELEPECRTYPSPQEAMLAPREKEVFVTALRVGINAVPPDYLATVDADPASLSYGKIVSRVVPKLATNPWARRGLTRCDSSAATALPTFGSEPRGKARNGKIRRRLRAA